MCQNSSSQAIDILGNISYQVINHINGSVYVLVVKSISLTLIYRSTYIQHTNSHTLVNKYNSFIYCTWILFEIEFAKRGFEVIKYHYTS